jgi:hypothetical protein
MAMKRRMGRKTITSLSVLARNGFRQMDGTPVVPPVRVIPEGNGLWPTPTTQDASNNGGRAQHRWNSKPLNAAVGGKLNPTWVEWLMGFPLGWTDLDPSEMPSSRRSRKSSGTKSSPTKRDDT